MILTPHIPLPNAKPSYGRPHKKIQSCDRTCSVYYLQNFCKEIYENTKITCLLYSTKPSKYRDFYHYYLFLIHIEI